jgi:glycine/D-amino acid oxidase-like deaminating enzyme
MPQHFVILGGGLAGTFMATRLCAAGQRVTLIDDRHPDSASRVAAGLFNVITGRHGAKSWLADTLLAEIKAFFADPIATEARQHVHYLDIYRPFKTTEAYNQWTGRAQEPAYAPLVSFQETPLVPNQVINPYGGIMIHGCGWVDTGAMIDAQLPHLELTHQLRRLTGSISYDHVDLAEQTIQLRNERLPFDHLICCEGHRFTQNPWFDFVTMIPNKGDILEIEAPGLTLPFALSKKVYLVPIGQGRWVCGSTYANQFADPSPTPQGRAEIEGHLQQAIGVSYEVVGHRAAIRPTTPNRRPIVGTHPDYPHVHTLTGFGTKGILLGPYTSRLLTQKILTGQDEIPAEASLGRFLRT